MSSRTYNNLWREAVTNLKEITIKDAKIQAQPNVMVKELYHPDIIELYYRYITAANKLNCCYDQVVHPQKRIILRKMLDTCLIRILEVKNDLVVADLDEFSYNDDILIKRQNNPYDVELEIPKYSKQERKEIMEKYNKMIDETRSKNGLDVPIIQKPPPTEAEAIIIIQKHERGRQGRFRLVFLEKMRKLKDTDEEDYTKNLDLKNMSALIIQKLYRGFKERCKINKFRTQEMIFLGQLYPPPTESIALKKINKTEITKHKVQVEYQKSYESALVNVEANIREKKTYDIMDRIGDEIRLFFREYYDENNIFPEFPEEEEGGSKPMLERGAVMDETERKRLKEKDKKPKKKEKDESGKKAKDKKEKPQQGYKATQSKTLPEISVENEKYSSTWKNKNESNNPLQKHDNDIIRAEKQELVESELRIIVDELMRVELDLLQDAWNKDNGIKTKKKGKKKKGKNKEKKNKKTPKDITADKTFEELFEELVENGIIRKYPEVSMKSFIGEKSYAAFELRNLGQDPPPCLGDVRELVNEYCIIPMGSDLIHGTIPLIKSVLISGPAGSGKKMLVNVVCTALGAILFDLSADNINGKYNSKDGLNMLVHLINKMSRLLQPSIIFIDQAEMMYAKKIPKEVINDPKRLGKDLSKIVKGITTEDRVLVIGTSSSPWNGSGGFMKTYQKFIPIPCPDYGTRSFYLKQQIMQHSGMQIGMAPQFEVACIARISEGCTIGILLQILNSVLTTQRNIQMQVTPLRHQEFLGEILQVPKVTYDDISTAQKWWMKTPVGKQKSKLLNEGTKKKKK